MPWSFDAVALIPSFTCGYGLRPAELPVPAWASWRSCSHGRASEVTSPTACARCLGLLAMPMVVVQATDDEERPGAGILPLVLDRRVATPCRDGPTRATVAARGSRPGVRGGQQAHRAPVRWGRRRGVAVVPAASAVRCRPGSSPGSCVMLVLIGSLEIYVNNHLQFGDWRGDPLLYRYNSNNDGWRGFVANELRYARESVRPSASAVGRSTPLCAPEVQRRASISCKPFVFRDLGLMSLPWRPLSDDDLRRLMTTAVINDARSTYGPVGALLMTVAPVALCRAPPFRLPGGALPGRGDRAGADRVHAGLAHREPSPISSPPRAYRGPGRVS